MINKQELRIGNLIFAKTNGGDFCEAYVFSIGYNHASLLINNHLHNIVYDTLNPIPLSEDWLKRLGFRETESEDYKEFVIDFSIDSQYKGYSKQFYVTRTSDTEFSSNFHNPDGVYWLRFTTVHQLQNLYYAITGEELTVEL